MDDNKRNLHYFEAESMAGLYEVLRAWQEQEQKRLLSVEVQSDAGTFCCIALTNPTEVIIMDGSPYGGATLFPPTRGTTVRRLATT